MSTLTEITDNPMELLSKHLFWDTPLTKIEVEKDKSFIIHRVLEYGLIDDWHLIAAWYGLTEIGRVATQFRTLDPKALAFLVNITGLPINWDYYSPLKKLNAIMGRGSKKDFIDLYFILKNTKMALFPWYLRVLPILMMPMSRKCHLCSIILPGKQ
ncbi:MAG: hypothetical protein NWR79_06525 [Saprospiraceae bacterium]|nr:hypothetical protein [Saprospiraceae bacterium]